MPTAGGDRDRDVSIGALEAFAEATGRRLENMDDKLDKILAKAGESITLASVLKQRVDRIEPIIDRIQPLVDRIDPDKLRNPIVVSLAGGTTAVSFIEGAKLVLKKFGVL